MGALSAWSHLPHFMSDMDHNMNFYQRCKNTIYSLYDAAGRRFIHSSKMDQMARSVFSDLEKKRGFLPTTYELQKSISVILVNSHPVLNHPRPKMPGLIDVSGIHIRKPKPLSHDIQVSLQFIYIKLFIYILTGVPRQRNRRSNLYELWYIYGAFFYA